MKNNRIEFASDLIYEGEIKDGKINGKGTMYYPGGMVYTGEWKDGKHHGDGTMMYLGRIVYDGQWENGERQGYGMEYLVNGDVYAGQWEQGKKHGKGKLNCANGNCFEGTWKNNVLRGEVSAKYSDGSRYEGEFVYDTPHGKGIMIYGNGECFEGIFEDGEFSQGIFTYVTKEQYEGTWLKNVRHGKGVFYFNDGSKSFVKYKRGKLIQADDKALAFLNMSKEDLPTYDDKWMSIISSYETFGGSGSVIYTFPLYKGKIDKIDLELMNGDEALMSPLEVIDLNDDNVSFVVSGRYLESGRDEIYNLPLDGSYQTFKKAELHEASIEGDDFTYTSERVKTFITAKSFLSIYIESVKKQNGTNIRTKRHTYVPMKPKEYVLNPMIDVTQQMNVSKLNVLNDNQIEYLNQTYTFTKENNTCVIKKKFENETIIIFITLYALVE